VTDISRPPLSSRQQPYHPAEALSDADAAEQQIVSMSDGSLHHYLPPGTIAHQAGYSHVPVTTSRTEGSAANSDQRNFGAYGASNQPSATNKVGK
jgi:hypothetical protein